MNKILPLIIAFLFVSTTSCLVKHIDALTTFKFTGNIYDLSTSKPLGDVNFSFVDNGYDHVRSKKNHQLSIGRSDQAGNINHDFKYFWGRNEAWFYSKPSETFEIVLNKDGYKEKRIFFKESDLEIIDGKIMVPLGFIYLERK